MRRLHWTAWLLGCCGALAPTQVDAQQAPVDPSRALDRREQHLRAMLEKLRAGALPTLAEIVAVAPLPDAAAPSTAPWPELTLQDKLPGEEKIAFERARVAALRDELLLARQRAAREAAAEAAAEHAAEAASATEPPKPERTEALAKDPLRLADALARAGKLAEALASYEAAGAEAEKEHALARVARARYGAARCLERLGRANEALPLYEAVESIPEAGAFVNAARFARRFIAWKRAMSSAKEER
ncbi:MAG: hypothetical protein D6731_20410 [Planctomycetota bacterium]|nr:MAG: hypothetical protein D6731_20410 [Planctomycetota bacterium]